MRKRSHWPYSQYNLSCAKEIGPSTFTKISSHRPTRTSKNPLFRERFQKACLKAKGIYAYLEFDVPELLAFVLKNYDEVVQAEIDQLMRLDPSPMVFDAISYYKKLINNIKTSNSLDYKNYLELAMMEQFIKSCLFDSKLRRENGKFDNFFLFQRDQVIELTRHHIMAIPTYHSFTVEDLNYHMKNDYFIIGMTDHRISYDSELNRNPIRFYEHDLAHALDYAYFIRTLKKEKIDRKIFITSILDSIEN